MVTSGFFVILVLIILFGLIFALTNGLHDASSVVATFISCGAATPRQAIILASTFGLLGAILGGSGVADTVLGIIDLPAQPGLLMVLLASIFGATVWNIITWRLGLPSSSTHALIGGIIGAVIVSHGPQHVFWGISELFSPSHSLAGISKVVFFLLVSPVLGFIAAFVLGKILGIILKNAKFSTNIWLKRLQWLISSVLAFNHGANDTQKIIGLLTLALACAGGAPLYTAPLWVRICGGSVMFLGTLLGGWSIMKTIGSRIYKLRPIHSFNSQLAAAGSVFLANLLGAPVSTTHVVVGSVTGAGAADKYKMVNWETAKGIIASWVITIPLSGLVSALIYFLISLVPGLI